MAEPTTPAAQANPATPTAQATPAAPAAPATPPAPRATPSSEAGPSALYPPDARDKLALRLQNAVNSFVDSPRAAVENADGVLEEAIADLTHLLTEHRRTLRTSWEAHPTEGATGDTEALRLALRDYRETAERLLRL